MISPAWVVHLPRKVAFPLKVWIDNTYYLQRGTVEFIVKNLAEFPTEIITELIGRSEPTGVSDDVLFIGESDANPYAFSCTYRSEAALDWISDQDWILPFADYCGKRQSELTGEVISVQEFLTNQKREFNTSDLEYRKQHFREMAELEAKSLHHIEDLKLMGQYRNHAIRFDFPKWYNPPGRRHSMILNLFGRRRVESVG